VVSKRLCVLVSQVWPGTATRIFGLQQNRRNRFAGLRVERPCQNGGVVLKMTAKNERIRRERELIHALELLRRRAPDAREPAISSSFRLKLQAGISDFIRLTWTCDSISFLVSLVLCLTSMPYAMTVCMIFFKR